MKYELKEAIVVRGRNIDAATSGAVNGGFPLGNQFQVRVLPEMNDIEETDLLPTFPNFFANQQTAYQRGDKVWVFCTEDFQAGFILGKTQGASGSEISPLVLEINNALINAGMKPSGFNNLTIENASGTSLRFFDEDAGIAGVIYANRTVYIYGNRGEIWINNPGMKAFVSSQGEMTVDARSFDQTLSGDKTEQIQGNSTETVATKRIETSGMMTISTGGSRQDVTAGNKVEMVAGSSSETVALNKSETFMTGYSMVVASGGLTITNMVGPISLFGTLGVNISSATEITLAAPIINTPPGVVAPTGVGGLCAIPVCLFAAGVPHVGNVLAGV